MGVVLLELPHSRQSAQRSGGLIPVQNTEISNPQGKLTVAPLAMAKENKVPGAVHGLERPLLLFNLELEHVVTVVLPVARGLPNTNIIHVRSLDLLITTLPVLRAQKRLKGVEDLRTIGKKESGTWGNLVKEEQFLVLSNPQVVALFGLLQKLQVLLHQLLVGEGHTTNTLQGVVALVA